MTSSWVNRHEWANGKPPRSVAVTALSNEFTTCTDPTVLQAFCDRLGPAQSQALCHRWLDALPTPLSDADEVAGY